MQNQPQHSSSIGMGLDDIYYVLFRHKWKIIIPFVIGIVGAAIIYRLKPPDYQSEAQLYIKYVADNNSLTTTSSETRLNVGELAPESVINSEIQILCTLDVAKQAAIEIGPERILAKVGGGNDPVRAASYIKSHLKAGLVSHSTIVQIEFKHPDPELVQPVLGKVISQYLKKYEEVHMMAGKINEILRQTTDELKNNLKQTDDELDKAKNEAGVFQPTADAIKANSEAMALTRQNIRTAEADLADLRATYAEMLDLSSNKEENHSNTVATTNANLNASPERIPDRIKDEYNGIVKHIADLRAVNESLLRDFNPDSPRVKDNLDEINKAETDKARYVTNYPGLVSEYIPTSTPSTMAPPEARQQFDPTMNIYLTRYRIAGLTTRIAVLNKQLIEMTNAEGKIAAVAPRIQQLENIRELQKADLKTYEASLEDSKIREGLGSATFLNIKVIEDPLPPGRDWGKRYKAMGMLVVAGLFGGVAWAFLIELYLDLTVKRPKEIKTKLGMSLFLSIPDVGKNGHRRPALPGIRPALKDAESGGVSGTTGNRSFAAGERLEIAPWDPSHSLRPFYEALRDRLLGYFEAKNLTHNPKLVALAGCSKGSGATTLAMGLAASLSETGDGNVLLVDMNQEQGAAQHFYMGKPHCGLDEVLESGNRDNALVQQNLYVVSANSNGEKLPRILPKRFASLLPKLKASDYDYIIFDMPPVSETSVTLRLAGFMDTMLLVVESEKTVRSAVTEAVSLLADAKANASIVLNKTRSYVPARLYQGS